MRAGKHTRTYRHIIILFLVLLLCFFSTYALLVTDTTFENGIFYGTTNANNLMMAPPNLIAWYELNETAGAVAYDLSPNQNNGSIQGATRVAGVGYSFDGIDDRIRMSHISAYDTTYITIIAWVSFANLDYVGNTGQYHAIVSKGAQDEDFFMGYDNTNTADDFFGEIGIAGGSISTTANQPLPNNTMAMLTLMHNTNKRAQIFLADQSLGQSAPAADRFFDTGNIDIGDGYGTRQLNGTVAQVLIFNTTLTTAQLLEYYANLTLPSSGTYESQTYDLGSNPQTSISWNQNTPNGTSITMQYATSSSSSTGFNTWTTITSGEIFYPERRYLRYKVTMTSADRVTTPKISSITINSTQRGTFISFQSTTDLTEDGTSPYWCYLYINDTVTVQSRAYRYRIGSSAWSASQNILGSSPNYFASITENWAANNEELLFVEVTTNNSVGNVTTVILNKTILDVNHAPLFATIGDKTGIEKRALTFSISAYDQDGDTMTFTSDTFTISPITNGLADATWTPGSDDVGNNTVQFTVSDGTTIVLQTIYVNVQNVNDAPVFTSTPVIQGYVGEALNFSVTATDIDDEPLSFSASPSYFSFTSVDTSNNTNSTEYTGYVYNYIPISSHKDTTNMQISVNDGTIAVSQLVDFGIDYCGDYECQSAYENIDNCARDCDEYAFNKFSIVPPEKACFNTTINITVYNATSRYHCSSAAGAKYGLALCEPLSDVDLQFYYIGTDGILTEKGTATTNDEGLVQFLVDKIGTYKIVGTSEEFVKETINLKTQKCLTYNTTTTKNIIVNNVDNKLVEKFKNKIQEIIPVNNTLEQPLEIVPNDPKTNWILMLIYFVIVPILLASFIFTSSVYYNKYKDDNIYILKTRIYMKEQKLSILPLYMKIKKSITPYIETIKKPAVLYFTIAYEMVQPVVQPISDKIAKIYDKLMFKKK